MRNPGSRPPSRARAKKGKEISTEEPEYGHKTPKISVGWGHEKKDKKDKEKKVPTYLTLMEERKRDYKYRDFPTG